MPQTSINPLITYLKDIKPSGTAGVALSAGSYTTRVLNTQEGDTSFCSLASNQFTLEPGSYHVEAHAMIGLGGGNFTLPHKAKIRNITDSSDAIIGTSETADANASGVAMSNRSLCMGVITISSSKTFELQHRVASSGGGTTGVSCSFGDSETLAVVKITKLF